MSRYRVLVGLLMVGCGGLGTLVLAVEEKQVAVVGLGIASVGAILLVWPLVLAEQHRRIELQAQERERARQQERDRAGRARRPRCR